MNRAWIMLALLSANPLCASARSEMKAIRKLQKEIDAAQPAAQKVTVYKYFDDDSDAIVWGSVMPEKDDPLIESGEALVIDHRLQRLYLMKASTSGDWTVATTSYFRPEGTLAYVHYEVTSKGVHARRVGSHFYGPDGTLLKQTQTFEGGERNEKIPETFPDLSPTLYKTAAKFLRQLGPIDILNEW